ncbi:MAG: biotin--[acetyl-CoA-carboxylase] ligase [Clostridia bacterium]
MTLKENVLKLLEENRGSFLSGEELAQHFHVTRSAVWKVIKSLQDEGYQIKGLRKKGYALSEDTNILSAAAIGKYLDNDPFFKIRVFKSVDSTNEVAKREALNGAEEGSVWISEEQTAGKGRKGKSFYSPASTGIYMSILLRPSFPPMTASLLTSAAAAAVAVSLESIAGIKADIKWVNDIFVDGKKISGTLTESAMSVENNGLDYVIVGIGVNVQPPKNGFPAELETIAGSVLKTTDGYGDIRNRVAAEILKRLTGYYRELETRSFLPEYKSRLFFLGKEIDVLLPRETITATALDITDDCHLLVRLNDGTIKELDSGEISIKI